MIIEFNKNNKCWHIELSSNDLKICNLILCDQNNIYDVKAEWMKTMSRYFDDNVNNKFMYNPIEF